MASMLAFQAGAAQHVVSHRGVAQMFAGHQRAAAGRTDRATAVKVREPHALGGHAVDIRRLDLLLPVAAKFAITKVVRQDENDVGFERRFRRAGG